MRKYLLVALLVFASASASAADHSRFWNLTSVTITKLLSRAGGHDQLECRSMRE